jgi:hypothetical protein
MYDNFSNEMTKAAFKVLGNDPEVFDHIQGLADKSPSKVEGELMTFITSKVLGGVSSDAARDLVEAGLRTVRWSEIRQQLQS